MKEPCATCVARYLMSITIVWIQDLGALTAQAEAKHANTGLKMANLVNKVNLLTTKTKGATELPSLMTSSSLTSPVAYNHIYDLSKCVRHGHTFTKNNSPPGYTF